MISALNIALPNVLVDLAVLAIMATLGIKAWKKGFLGCLLTSISGIAAVFIAMMLAAPFLGWTNGLFGIQNRITEGIIKTLSQINVFNIDISSAAIEVLLEDTNLPKFLVNTLVDAGVEGMPMGTTLAMLAGEKLGEYAATMVSFGILFLLCKFGLRFLNRILGDVVSSLPIIGKVDSILGLCWGVLKGFLLISLVLAVFAILPSASMTDFFQDSILLRWIYNQNILHVIFGWFLN